MQCPAFREAVSARLDGEPAGMPELDLDRHLERCPACAAWAESAAVVTRRARLAPAPPMPDLTAAVLAALPRAPGAAAAARAYLVGTALRMALLAVGVAQATVSFPVLGAGAGAMGAPAHLAHESGAWNLAVAAAFLAVAAAPRLAAGALPFLGTFAALLLSVTVPDLAEGRVDLERAGVHLLLLLGVALVAAIAWRGRRRPVAASARRRVVA
jgi:predicted anti-sigma-YlaC factor YlaD